METLPFPTHPLTLATTVRYYRTEENICSTYASCKAASRFFNYLSQHPAVCIKYSGSSLDLHVYSDSDWGSDKDTRLSTSGVLIMMAGGPVNWISKLQPIVTVSSMEAEYLAYFFAIQDVVWIRQLLEDIDLEHARNTKVFIDNQSARQLAMNPVNHQRSEHIDIKYHWIRDKVAAQEIELVYVPTTEQRADFLTKTLPADVFWRHAVAIMHAIYYRKPHMLTACINRII